MLVFLTNASRPQTRDDLLSFCCQPKGQLITVDYRKCWIDDRVMHRDIEAWKDHAAILLCFDPRARFNQSRAPDKNPQAASGGDPEFDCSIPDAPLPEGAIDGDYLFVPIRYATVRKVQNHDASMTFLLELEDWFRYSAEPARCIEKLKEREAALFKVAPLRPRPGRVLDTKATGEQKSTFVVWDEEGVVFPKKSEQAASWTSTMLFLRTVRGLKDCVFASCLGSGNGGADSHPGPVLGGAVQLDRAEGSESVPGLTRARVKSGATHLVTVHLIPGEDAGPRRPEIQIDPAVASVIGPITRQRNAGSEVTFELAFAHQLVRRHAFLQVRIPPASSGTAPTNVLAQRKREGWDIVGPTFSVDVEIVPAGGVVQAFVVAIVLSAFFGSIDLGLCREIASRVLTTSTASGVDSAALQLLIVSKAAAIICAFAGSWIAVKYGMRRFLTA